ncbi:MAG: ATPase [Alphaproteobacteria bacterium RIFCSPLOWO2_01_FULL_45_8]|nr:MAG: ATPase [Alphaproteobacteria bacterium GWA1_45_9]OFW89848.1 MAG: ATPase [Alphaproteobacteria bacterium RIFCSPHIGHO2_01_FULL_41_14]OFW96048.1 MAG: ATPase [Alphaproteobacteria bacterium RIFCSPLOWO2_01_FULL_45_8]HCI48981.1 ATPase [Holosporales bacterium]
MNATSTPKKPYIIVLGNEKGGSGKSTTAMHVTMALLDLGFKVSSIDVDARQGTLTRYVENRLHYTKTHKAKLPMPDHHPLLKSEEDSTEKAHKEDDKTFASLLEKLKDSDFIVIDTPGSDLYLSHLAHSYADTIITPLNDSFVDLDVMVHLKPDSLELDKPSIYANRIWEQKKQKAMRERRSIDWIVLRNRLSNIHSANKQKMEEVLSTLSKRLAFRCVPGFSERVIFREMFLSGLTLLDLKTLGVPLQFSHIAAKQELRNLIEAISLPALTEKIKVSF